MMISLRDIVEINKDRIERYKDRVESYPHPQSAPDAAYRKEYSSE